ncbi:MAG: hypothetical protein PUJ55_02010 [Clostridiales bacterium]|nr:hypothetical protein [Clostridiales bacterium]MDY4112072.1 hypothetical protein [Roseburia sp.]
MRKTSHGRQYIFTRFCKNRELTANNGGSVSYAGKTVPGGTIGCEALNISDVLREKLAQASQPLREIVQAIGENRLTEELLRPAKDSVC